MITDIKPYLPFYLGCEAEVKITTANHILKKTISGHDLESKSSYEYIKPILRPLNDMTEEEAIELVRLTVYHKDYVNVRVNPNIYGDLIVCWGIGSEIGKFNATEEKFFSAEQFQYLLTSGFDVWNLIDAGLALNKTKL